MRETYLLSPWAEVAYVKHGGETRRDVVPCRGALGLWTVPAGVDDQVWHMLQAAEVESAAADEQPDHQNHEQRRHAEHHDHDEDLGGAESADGQGVHALEGTRP